MANHLKAITPEAKRLYKTGRYAKYSDAVKAAFKKKSFTKVPKKRKVSIGKRPVSHKVVHVKAHSVGTHSGTVSGQIGAIKKGSRYIYYKGVQIEKMPIEVPGKGKRKKKKFVFITHSKVHHTLKEAEASIRSMAV
jgi:hypothetical protein